MHDQMEKLNVAFMKAFEDQNADAIGPMYTEDCKVMPAGQDVIHGRKGEVDIAMCETVSAITLHVSIQIFQTLKSHNLMIGNTMGILHSFV